MVKQEAIRGSRRRFQTTITGLDGNPQDPVDCYVRLEKVGSYSYDSPTQWYSCSSVGTTGVWGADIWIPESLTLGDWVARFKWRLAADGVWDYDTFEFILERKDKPWVHTRGPKGVPE